MAPAQPAPPARSRASRAHFSRWAFAVGATAPILPSTDLVGDRGLPLVWCPHRRLDRVRASRDKSDVDEAFDDAAIRHWLDALLLEEGGRLDNSDHLLGLSAECGLKVALSACGYPVVDRAGALAGPYRYHIDALWARARLQSLQKSRPALVALLDSGEPFFDWRIEQRYGRSGEVQPSAHERHKLGARRVLGAVGLLGTLGGGRR